MVGAREGQKRDRERRLSTSAEDGEKEEMDLPSSVRHSQSLAFRKERWIEKMEKKNSEARGFDLGRCALSLTKVDQLVPVWSSLERITGIIIWKKKHVWVRL